MANRRPKKSDFVGKTIRSVNIHADNVWTFYFTDGTALAVEAEVYSMGNFPLPVLEVCETCVQPERCHALPKKEAKRPVTKTRRQPV